MSNNKVVIIFNLILGFFVSLIGSLILFIKSIFSPNKIKPLKENKFIDALDFVIQIWGKYFWKKPTTIKIGRFIGTFLSYIFDKEKYFKEKK